MCHHPLETDLGGKRLLLQDNLTSLEKAREENGDLTARLQKKCQEIQGGSEKTCPFSPGAKEIQLRTEFYFIRNRVIRSNYVLEKAERDVEFLKADIAALTRYYEESDVLAKRIPQELAAEIAMYGYCEHFHPQKTTPSHYPIPPMCLKF